MRSHFLRAGSGSIEIVSQTATIFPSSTTWTVTTPSGAESGDLLLVFLTTTSAVTISPPAAFSQVYHADPGTTSAGYVRGYAFSLQLTAAPAASYAFTLSSAANGPVLMLRIRRSKNLALVADTYSSTTQTGTTLTAPSLTSPSRALLLCCHHVDATAGFASNTSDLTLVDSRVSSSKEHWIGKKLVPAGATGTKTATITSGAYWNSGAVVIPF